MALFLLTFSGIGLVTGQLAQTAPQAYGLAFAVFLVIYLLRAVLDVRHRGGTWSNPESWLAEARPFSDQLIVWPWIAYSASIVVPTAIAMRIAGHQPGAAEHLTFRMERPASPGSLGRSVRWPASQVMSCRNVVLRPIRANTTAYPSRTANPSQEDSNPAAIPLSA